MLSRSPRSSWAGGAAGSLGPSLLNGPFARILSPPPAADTMLRALSRCFLPLLPVWVACELSGGGRPREVLRIWANPDRIAGRIQNQDRPAELVTSRAL